MCTYHTEKLAVSGSAKGPSGWFSVEEASVYFDHPVHAPADHTLNIDLFSWKTASVERVAVELDQDSARALAETILGALEALPDAGT